MVRAPWAEPPPLSARGEGSPPPGDRHRRDGWDKRGHDEENAVFLGHQVGAENRQEPGRCSLLLLRLSSPCLLYYLSIDPGRKRLRACLSVRFQGFTPTPQYRP